MEHPSGTALINIVQACQEYLRTPVLEFDALQSVSTERVNVALRWGGQIWLSWWNALIARLPKMSKRNDTPECLRAVCGLAALFLSSEIRAWKYVKDQTLFLAGRLLLQPDWVLDGVTTRESNRLPGVLGPGWICEHCRNLMGRSLSYRHRLAVAQDLLESKTSWPPISSDVVDLKLQDCFRLLTTPRPVTEQGELDRLILYGTELAEKIFHGAHFLPPARIPSLNACFENSRLKGGALGFFARKPLKITRPSRLPSEKTEGPEPDDPVVLVESDFGGVHTSQRVSLKGFDLLPAMWQGAQATGRELAGGRRVLVEQSPIPEPGKCRVISKNEALVGWPALSLQRFLHDRLRKLDVFEYIGHPIEKEGIHLDVPGPDEELVSGDWQASTDNIHQQLIVAIWETIANTVTVEDSFGRKIPLRQTDWYHLGLADLVRHTIVLSRGMIGVGEHCVGQLMGSPCSFPVLCIINAAITGRSLGMTPEGVISEQRRFRCNGDDVAFVGQAGTTVKTWIQNSSVAGLSWSPGKTYVSRWFVQMNSECFEVLPEGYVRVGAFNPSLCFGLERKGIDAGKDLRPEMGWWEIGPRARELIEAVPAAVADRWLDVLEDAHAEVIRRMPPGTARETPPRLGGAGLPVRRAVPIGCRQTAAYLACLDPQTRTKILPGKRLEGGPADALREAEDYYAQFIPRVEVARDPMDVLLDRWGFPVDREPSALGAGLRLAYVLWKGATGSSSEVTHGAGLTPGDCPLAGAAFKAQRVVADHDLVEGGPCTREGAGDGVCHFPGCSKKLHPMKEDTFESWLPPVETRLLWESVRGLPHWQPRLLETIDPCDDGLRARLAEEELGADDGFRGNGHVNDPRLGEVRVDLPKFPY